MALSNAARIWLGRAGTVLAVLGIAFVAERLASYAGEIDIGAIGALGWTALLLLAAAYGTACLLLARSWWHLLRHVGLTAEWPWARRTYAISQLAKYVPGNVMQFAGRQAIGVAAGFANGPLFKSTLLELLLLCGLSLVFLPLAGLAPPLSLPPWLAAVGVAALVLVGLGAAYRMLGVDAFWAGLYHLMFLVAAAVVFVGCAIVAGVGLTLEQIPMVVGAYTLAWLAGLLTPGAPAGLGVRDGLLLLMLGHLGSEPTIVLAVLLGRLVTVCGDLAFFVLAGLVGHPRAQ